jgi:hypothetical protein
MLTTLAAAALLSTGGCKKEVDLTEAYQPRPASVLLEDVGDEYEGRWVTGEATVTEVFSDRGFYVGEEPNRLLTVVREDAPQYDMIDIREGDRIRVTGLLLDPAWADRLTGTLEEDAKQRIAQSDRFLATYWADIAFLERGDVPAGDVPAGVTQGQGAGQAAQTMPTFASADANTDMRVEQDELGTVLQGLDRSPWDLDDSGTIEPAETRTYLFQRLDPDGDNRMRTGTLDVVLDRWYGERDVPAGEAWDTDSDGWVTPSEFEAQAERLRGGVWDTDGDGAVIDQELAAGVFQTWDLDDSGYLDQYEYDYGRDEVIGATTGISPSAMSGYDQDASGGLARDEFDQWANEYGWFDRWDLDRDDTLTRNELDRGMYSWWDLDNDGLIEGWEYDEVNAGWYADELGAYDQWDTDANDRITRSEFDARIQKVDAWERWDADQSGSLTEEEFRSGVFETWDRNGDDAMGVEEPGFSG